MNNDLHRTIMQRLVNDFEFQAQDGWLRKGRCPSCGKREMYANSESPWVVRCPRANNCSYTAHVKDLYPDVFSSWSDRYKATPESPNEAALAYLKYARGLDVSKLGNCFEQGNYFDSESQQGSATVRFPLAAGGWWERLIDRPERFGKKKAVFKPGTKYQGTWWVPPGLDIGTSDELWITEGIFNTLALREAGVNSVATLTCNNYPETALKALVAERGQRITLMWALDSDQAGRNFTTKWVERAEADGWTCKAAQIPQHAKGKIDWNDLLARGQLTADHLDKYRYQGALLLAQDANEKALLIYSQTNRRAFAFDYRNRMYWFSLDIDKYNKAREQQRESDKSLSDDEARNKALAESGTVSEISNCLPTALYFQKADVTDDSWYYFRVDFPHDGPSVKGTFTSGNVTSSSEFKKRLMHIAPGALYFGTGPQLDRMMKDQLFNIKRVDTIDFIGYSKEHGCYLFNDLAVKDGKVYDINEQDFFDIEKLSLKSLNQSVHLAINKDHREYNPQWIPTLYAAFGAKGMVALAFWMGSLFAEQIRMTQKSYPFLEIVGEPGTGKSTLIEFLWKLFGRNDYEGFDPSKSTLAARSRNFAQVSGLPVVLIESDRDQDKAKVATFDWDELKTAYNGRSTRARGLKTSGNETYEPPFRGSIVIAQNAPVNASEAILSRIVHIPFDRASQTPHTYAMAQRIESWSTEELSGFVLQAVQREKEILELVGARSSIHMQQLLQQGAIRVPRIAKNHGLMMALAEALAMLIKMPADNLRATHALITAMALERQQSISADHPVVHEFWEAYEYLNSMGDSPRLNHGQPSGEYICINLNHFLERANEHRQQVPQMVDLKRHLKSSRSRRYVDQTVVRSAILTDGNDEPRNVRCWRFEIPKAKQTART